LGAALAEQVASAGGADILRELFNAEQQINAEQQRNF
jgi:hypothetical protein